MSIHFHAVDTPFSLRNRTITRQWLHQCIEHYGKTIGELSFIFCSDKYLLELNRTHLAHDYYTDIITFDYNQGDVLSGDLYLSIDRIRDNAKSLKLSSNEELHRVMIHGVLHLIGFGDKTPDQAKTMRAQEDYCLTLR